MKIDLTDHLKAAGLNRTQLADKMGITYNHLWRIESGNRRPSLPVLARLSKALDVAINDLVDVDDLIDDPKL